MESDSVVDTKEPTVAPPTFEEMSSDETSGVLYNAGFGGFRLNTAAAQAMKDANLPIVNGYSRDDRTNQTAVQIVIQTYDPKAKSRVRVQLIPKPFVKYIHIDEYDGSEDVLYDWKMIYADALQMIASGQFKSLADAEAYMKRAMTLGDTTYDDPLPRPL
ncbi:MAG: hypothetical protein WC763_06590 [Candidatus Paceibacterota bacterium]